MPAQIIHPSAAAHTASKIFRVPFSFTLYLSAFQIQIPPHFMSARFLYFALAGSTLTDLPLIFACFIACNTDMPYSLGTSTKV